MGRRGKEARVTPAKLTCADDAPKRSLHIVWCRRGVEIEVVKVYRDGKRRALVRLHLTPSEATRVARMLRGAE